ncbi:MAG TPA: HAMP domain-containing sensor histidine kinase [Gemmatimonadales bacterium]
MASVRTKLTATYAVALVATIVVFGAALTIAKTVSTQHVVRRLATERAELVVRVLRQAADDPEPLVTLDDSLVPRLRTEVGSRLTPLRDYLLVLAADGRVLFNSDAAASLSAIDTTKVAGLDDDQIYARRLEAWRTYDNFVRLGRALTEARLDTIAEVAGNDVLVVSRPLRDPAIPVERVVVGIPVGWLASQSRRELLGTMVVIAPVLIVLSVGAAFLLAGHTFKPLERLMTQLEAITDGRSLHRRLPVDDSDDEIARLSATLNAMLGRLENYFGALRRFTADASHELKTPLTVLRADVERAMHANTTATERLVALEEALQETTRMADLVEQLLTLARADEGRFDLHREPVALGPVVRDVLETAHILGEEGGITVRTPVLEDVTVMGDGARLRQLFLNLVTNAIKYTPRGGEVEIALRGAGDVVTFQVRDSGIGIAAADLPYIFDRFWRADRVRSRSGARGGFGLGLAISQWIAQAHGGSLTATSRLGRGSVFTVTLPFAPEGSTAEYPVPRLARLAGQGAAD